VICEINVFLTTIFVHEITEDILSLYTAIISGPRLLAFSLDRSCDSFDLSYSRDGKREFLYLI